MSPRGPRREPPAHAYVPPPLPAKHPAMFAAWSLTAACVLYSVTTVIGDPDVWEHLAVGRAIWQLRAVPVVNLWVWPVHGQPDVCVSWLFRALLWPFWLAGGLAGLTAWRWATTLAAFVLLLLTARRMDARGFSALAVLGLAGLTWRHRSQVRPETLVAVLLAAELWLLESWRIGARARARARGAFPLDRRAAVVPLIWIWANAHVSWPLGLALLGAYGVDAVLSPARASRSNRAAEFIALALAAAALTFVNPSGMRAVVQPFDFLLHQRGDPLYTSIGELGPLEWRHFWRTGLPLLFAGWPILIVGRTRVRRLDAAEAIACVVFSGFALLSQRFAGFFALVAAPFVARDLADVLGARTSRFPVWARFGAFAAGLLALSALEWTRRDVKPGIGFDLRQYPVGACDFVLAHGLAGPLFNEYYYGGYLLWRFWPETSRLPFMDVHQSGTPEDRKLYPYVFANADAWRTLEQRRKFEVALIDGSVRGVIGNRLPDQLDADPSWALVFRDDAACVYVRRDGRHRKLAAQEAYRVIPGGAERLEPLGAECARDTSVRRAAREELERQAGESAFNARASSLLANLAFMDGHPDEARSWLQRALAADPETPTAHERLGLLAMKLGQPRAALAEFDLESKLGPGTGELELHRGQAYEAAGDRSNALAAYGRQLRQRPDDPDARDAIARLGTAGRP